MSDQPAIKRLHLREQDLASKVAIVTGATKGIGRAIAANLASRGCSILATCSSSETLHLIDSLSHETSDLYKNSSTLNPPKIAGTVANMSSPDCPQLIADNLVRLFDGYVDIYINNAAPREMAKVGSLDAEHIQKYCLGNIQNPALIVDELVKRKMFRKDSRIVLISSARGRKPSHLTPMYCVVKSAGESLVRCEFKKGREESMRIILLIKDAGWADAFGGKDPEFEFMSGTTANSLMVGITKTDAINRHGQEFLDRIMQEWLPHMSMPRPAEPEDVADVVGLLCSRDARWITGSVVSADGGGLKII